MTALDVADAAAIGRPAGLDDRRTRARVGVMLCFLTHGLIVSTWVSRIASVKGLLHLSDGVLGLALLGTAIGSVTAIPVCGGLVTRYGSRRAVQWTGVGFSAALILPALAWNAWQLFAALLVYGAMAGANDVAMNAQAVATEKLLGAPAMSRFHSMFSIGGIAGAAIGGIIASRGATPAAHLAAAAVVLVALSIMASHLRVEATHHVAASVRRRASRLPVALLALSLIGFCIFLSEGAMADWAGVFLKQVIGATDAYAAAGYAVFSAAMALFRLAGDWITVKLGRAETIRCGASLAAAGIALAASAHSLGWALVGFAAAGAGYSSIIPLVFAAGGRIEGVAEGSGVATVSGIGYLGFLAGPPAIGFISQLSSLRVGLALLVALGITAAVLVTVAFGARRPPHTARAAVMRVE